MIKTTDEIRRELADYGVAVSEWARRHGYSPALVPQVLAGRLRCQRGQAHEIAVRLGLKAGHTGGVDALIAEHSSDDEEKQADVGQDSGDGGGQQQRPQPRTDPAPHIGGADPTVGSGLLGLADRVSFVGMTPLLEPRPPFDPPLAIAATSNMQS